MDLRHFRRNAYSSIYSPAHQNKSVINFQVLNTNFNNAKRTHKKYHAEYSLIFSTWIAHFASFDLRFSWAIVAMTNPAIDRTNVTAGKIARRNEYACPRRWEPMAEARNDREGFFSRARDRFTVTSYVSALHIPGPCPETIWIPNTSRHNRRFKVPGGRWSRIPNRIIGPGSRSLAATWDRESDPPLGLAPVIGQW